MDSSISEDSFSISRLFVTKVEDSILTRDIFFIMNVCVYSVFGCDVFKYALRNIYTFISVSDINNTYPA